MNRVDSVSLKAIMIYLVFLTISGCAPTLVGKVTDMEGKTLEAENGRINVLQLTKVEGKPASRVLAIGSDGGFSTDTKLPSGEYLVEALIPGYRVESIRVNLAKPQRVAFSLRKLTSIDPSALKIEGEIIQDQGGGQTTLTPPKL